MAATYDVAALVEMLNRIYARREGGKLIPNRVSAGQAVQLVAIGQKAIGEARKLAVGLPGAPAREDVFWRLDWHQKTASAMPASADYAAHKDELRELVTRSFVEVNAAADARAWADRITFFGEIGRHLEELAPKLAIGFGSTIGIAVVVLVGFLVASRWARG